MIDIKYFVFFLLCALNLTTNNDIILTNIQKNIDEQSNKVELKERVVYLAREICDDNKYISMCDDGFYQGFSLYPKLVKLDITDFIKSYNDTIYSFTYLSSLDSIRKSHGFDKETWELNDMINASVSSINTIELKIPKRIFKRYKKYIKQYNKFFKKSSDNSKISNKIGYSLYKMKIKYVYVGKTKFILPFQKGDALFTEKESYHYSILNIEELQPISHLEYITNITKQ